MAAVFTTLLFLALYTGLVSWRARRRAIRDSAQFLRQLPIEEREKVLAALADQGMRTDLSREVSSDQPLPDQASVARFHVAPGSRRDLLWDVVRPALASLGCLAIIGVSGAVNPTLNVLCAGGSLLALLLIAWRMPRLARSDRIIEVSPFNLTEINGRGRRRVLSWRQPLLLRYRARHRRVEVGPEGSRECIYIDADLLEFRRAVGLILEYGGFVVQPPAT